MSTKQRMIGAADLRSREYRAIPMEARATAVGLWLHTDVLGRRELDEDSIATDLGVPVETITDHLVLLSDAGFLDFYKAQGREWLALRRPLKVDTRGARVESPDPPWISVAVGGEGARERARARVRAEDAARAAAWEAVQADREEPVEEPERPFVLDAPPAFCPDHMPAGAGRKRCGPCRDHRVVRDEWLARRIYEQRLTEYEEASDAGN